MKLIIILMVLSVSTLANTDCKSTLLAKYEIQDWNAETICKDMTAEMLTCIKDIENRRHSSFLIKENWLQSNLDLTICKENLSLEDQENINTCTVNTIEKFKASMPVKEFVTYAFGGNVKSIDEYIENEDLYKSIRSQCIDSKSYKELNSLNSCLNTVSNKLTKSYRDIDHLDSGYFFFQDEEHRTNNYSNYIEGGELLLRNCVVNQELRNKSEEVIECSDTIGKMYGHNGRIPFQTYREKNSHEGVFLTAHIPAARITFDLTLNRCDSAEKRNTYINEVLPCFTHAMNNIAIAELDKDRNFIRETCVQQSILSQMSIDLRSPIQPLRQPAVEGTDLIKELTVGTEVSTVGVNTPQGSIE